MNGHKSAQWEIVSTHLLPSSVSFFNSAYSTDEERTGLYRILGADLVARLASKPSTPAAPRERYVGFDTILTIQDPALITQIVRALSDEFKNAHYSNANHLYIDLFSFQQLPNENHIALLTALGAERVNHLIDQTDGRPAFKIRLREMATSAGIAATTNQPTRAASAAPVQQQQSAAPAASTLNSTGLFSVRAAVVASPTVSKAEILIIANSYEPSRFRTPGPELQAIIDLCNNSNEQNISLKLIQDAITGVANKKGSKKSARLEILSNPNSHDDDKTGVSTVIREIGKKFQEIIAQQNTSQRRPM